MNKYTISATYGAGTKSTIELPESKTWEDVKEWHVKWDTVHITFKDSTQVDIKLHSDTLDVIDWKLPTEVAVYAVFEDGETNYDEEVA